MVKNCANCENSKWRDGTTPISDICVDCNYVDENGCKQPSNWKPKTQTNADRIRAMSDEELSEFLNRVKQPCDYCHLMDTYGACTETLCDDAMMNWLKQPAEVET